jgi:ABC-type transporter Mla maintaining outer membrane lipid asymmetry ATPase subunit MlaF
MSTRTTNSRSGADDSDALVRVRDLHYSRGTRVIFRGIDVTIRRGGYFSRHRCDHSSR